MKPLLYSFVISVLFSNFLNAATFYVSPEGQDTNPGTESQPFRTLEKARDSLRSIGPAGNTVILRGGDYFLDQTFTLDDRDGGTEQEPVTWKNYPDEEPRIFGGPRITGWEQYEDDIYRARLDLPDYVNLETMAWTLSENAKRSPHARHPNVFSGPGHGFFKSQRWQEARTVWGEGEFPSDWQDDYHCRMVAGWGWFSQLWPVKNVDFANYEIIHDPKIKDSRGLLFVSGAVEFIDLPGEWAIADDGYLYYWPKNTPIENQVIVLGILLRVVELKGRSDGTPAKNLIIDGLTVSTSDCTYRGLSNKQTPTDLDDGTTANCDDDYSRQALLVLENAEHCTVTNSKFYNAGIMGILLNYHAQYNTVSGNWIQGVNYHGICLQSYCGETGPWVYNNKYNTISNNYIYRTGRRWSNGAGIYLHQSGNNLIEYNEFREGPRYGITLKGVNYVGDQRGDFCCGDYDCAINHIFTQHNVIRNNDLSHAIHSTNDCGVIESWNIGPHDSLYHNFLHDCYHPAINARTYNSSDDPALATTPEWYHTGGLSHRQPFYPDGAGRHEGNYYYEGHAVSNIVDAKAGHYDHTIMPCRSAVIDAATNYNWDEIGLRETFKWYGQTPATDALDEEWEFPEEIVHDPDYIPEYMKRFNDGTGLTATYFNDDNFGNQVKTQVDSIMAFNWVKQSPTGSNRFSVRWEGYLVPIRTERHRFSCWIPKNWSCKVWINDTLRLHDDSYSQFGYCRFGDTLTGPLEAYSYVPIKVEVASAAATGYFSLEWYSLTAIPTMPVMPTQLYPKDHDTSRPPGGYDGGLPVENADISTVRHAAVPLLTVYGTTVHINTHRTGSHEVRLIGLDGKMIDRINGRGTFMMDLARYGSGVYLISVARGKSKTMQRVVIKK
ncbi:MAG: hypothetical protein GF350_06975 [Chitinivibrionales bacterium]|nr:hypothetical protein [Chitinivibrionales bacterium]